MLGVLLLPCQLPNPDVWYLLTNRLCGPDAQGITAQLINCNLRKINKHSAFHPKHTLQPSAISKSSASGSGV